MRFSTSGLVATSFALTYTTTALYQHALFPVGLFAETVQVTPLINNYITTDDPASPRCRCADGHHDPIMFKYKNKPLVGWIHSSLMDYPANALIDGAFRYHIEVDPSPGSLAELSVKTRPNYAVKSEISDGVVQVAVLNSEFRLLEPYDNGDGRFYFQVVGTPFSTVLMPEAEYNQQVQLQTAEWKQVLGSAPNEIPGNFLLTANAASRGQLLKRLNLDAFVTPAIPAVLAAASVLGICAAVRRR